MSIVFAAIAPHGFTVIPDMSDDAEGGLQTRAAMEEMGRRCRAAKPDVIVIATPHGFRVEGTMCVLDASRAAGTLRWQGRQVEQNVPIDRAFARTLIDTAISEHVPVSVGGYAGGGAYGVVPLDWGVITPLWFAAYPTNMTGRGDVLASGPAGGDGPGVVIVGPARGLTPDIPMAFGRALASAAASDGRRVAYIASCDWAHTHAAGGPYGFHEAAERMDGAVFAAVREADLTRLATLPPDDVANAAMDGLPQALILAGLLERAPLQVDFLSYEAPTYYGMLVATYQ